MQLFYYQSISTESTQNLSNSTITDFQRKSFLLTSKNINFVGLYGGILSNMAALVDVELKKREANTSAAKWLARTMITGETTQIQINWFRKCLK